MLHSVWSMKALPFLRRTGKWVSASSLYWVQVLIILEQNCSFSVSIACFCLCVSVCVSVCVREWVSKCVCILVSSLSACSIFLGGKCFKVLEVWSLFFLLLTQSKGDICVDANEHKITNKPLTNTLHNKHQQDRLQMLYNKYKPAQKQ